MTRKCEVVAFIVLVMVMTGIVTAAVQIDRTGSFEITWYTSWNDNENGMRIFDDTTQTKWLSNGGAAGWIAFDYSEDEAYAINGYTITSANDSPSRTPRDWSLDGSNDGGATWTPLDTRTGETGWVEFEKRSYSFTNTTAYKMYRLNVTNNNGDGLMGFSEMELLEGSVDTTTLPGTFTTSSHISNQEWGYAAFDNSVNTKWLTNFTTTGWIIFDFPDDAAYAINGYAIASANDSPDRTPKNWTLQGSNNGSTWTTVDTQTDETGWDTYERRTYLFNNTAAYQMYRLNVTANNGSDNLMGFSELELLEIIDDPQITSMSPSNFHAVSASPLVLEWDSAFETAAATYTVHLGTDPNFTDAGSLEVAGITDKQWTVPEASITDDTIYYWRVDIVDDPYGTGTQTFMGPVVKFRLFRQVQKVLEWSMDNYGEGTVYSYENPIQNVTATASSQESGSRSPGNTTGPGLIIDASISDPNGLGHTNQAWQMWISNPAQTGEVWIQYAFDQVYPIGTMLIWNHNVGDPYLAELNRGMRDVTVSYSLDATNWLVLGNYTIPVGTGVNGMPPSLAIPFEGIEAQYVRITAASVNGNWGATGHHALSEVRFGIYSQPVISYVMPDTSGNGNDGKTYVDPQLVSQAITGTAIDLSGNDMVYMEYTDPNAVSTLPLGSTEDCYDSWSMNFYTMLPQTPPSISFVVGFGDYEMGTGRYLCQFAEGIHFWGGDNVDGVTNVPFDLNRWQMITATYENGRLRIYKNGDEILNQATQLGVAIPRVSVSGITYWGTAPSSVIGLIDEFTIYKGALSQTEIDQLAAALPTQYAALNPIPEDESVNVAIDPILEWDAPLSAIDPTYDIYLGTDPNTLPIVASGLSETSLDTISLGLSYGTTYYWYVDTSTGDPSATWSFTTMPSSSISSLALSWDFESLTEYAMEYEQSIEDVVVTASSQEQGTRAANRAANGIGLFVDPYIPDANSIGLQHTNDADHMWICDPAQTGEVWIKFGFDQSYPLGTMLIWNHNVGEPWLSELNRGMRQVSVLYNDTDSSDPNDWTLMGDYEIPMGTGQNGMTASLGIDFGGIEAQYVKITAVDAAVDPNSNWGAAGNFHALSEVRFGIHGTTATAKVVPDASGNGNVGIISGTPAFVSGIGSGQCVRIDAPNIDNYGDQIDAEIVNAEVLPLGAAEPWSMNLYVYLPAAPPSSPNLFAGFGDTDQGTGRYIGYFNHIHFWGGHNVDVAASQQYRYGHWQMITVTYSGTELKLYKDGQEIASGAPGFIDAAASVNIAGLYPWNSYANRMNGMVDNFTLYKGVLTRSEIAALAEILPMEGDMDWNGTVDISDLMSFVADWLTPYDLTSPSDFTGDGYVTLDDFAVVAENWLQVQ